MSPLIVVLTVVCWLQLDLPPLFDEDHLKFQIQVHQAVLLAIGLLFLALSLYGSFFLNKCKKRLERVPIAVSSASCNDTWAIVVLITYVLPIASFALKDFNPWIAGSVILILLAVTVFSSAVFPSPLLILKGYHFFKLTNINGGGEYCLLTKRASISNSKSVNKVVCAFDYLMIEV